MMRPVPGDFSLALSCCLYFGLDLVAARGVNSVPGLPHVLQHAQPVLPAALSRIKRLRHVRKDVQQQARFPGISCAGVLTGRERPVLPRGALEAVPRDTVGFVGHFLAGSDLLLAGIVPCHDRSPRRAPRARRFGGMTNRARIQDPCPKRRDGVGVDPTGAGRRWLPCWKLYSSKCCV